MTRSAALVAAIVFLSTSVASAGAPLPATSRWKWTAPKGAPELGTVAFGAQHNGIGYVVSRTDRWGMWQVALDKTLAWTALPAPPASLAPRAAWSHDGATLVAVGGERDDILSSTAARYSGGRWEQLPALPQGRILHTVTILTDSSVLVIGGRVAASPDVKSFDATETATALVLRPGAKVWTPAPSLPTPRWLHTATRLTDGTVLVAGGSNEATENGDSDVMGIGPSWRLDARAGAWTSAGQMPTPRYLHEAIATPAGVLIVGGEVDGVGSATDAVVLFEPVKGRWRSLGKAPYATSGPAVAALPDGRVLVTGGGDVFTDGALPFSVDGAYVVDAATGRFDKVRKMPVGRAGHVVLVGKNGALVLGGSGLPFKPDPEQYEKPWAPSPPRLLRFR